MVEILGQCGKEEKFRLLALEQRTTARTGKTHAVERASLTPAYFTADDLIKPESWGAAAFLCSHPMIADAALGAL